MDEVVCGFLIMGFLLWIGSYIKPIENAINWIGFSLILFWSAIISIFLSIIFLPFAIIYKCLKD